MLELNERVEVAQKTMNELMTAEDWRKFNEKYGANIDPEVGIQEDGLYGTNTGNLVVFLATKYGLEGPRSIEDALQKVVQMEGMEHPGQESAPVDPAPVDPAPVDPAPVDPAPVDPAPVDPAPVDPAPVDPAPVDPDSVGPDSVGPDSDKNLSPLQQWIAGTFAALLEAHGPDSGVGISIGEDDVYIIGPNGTLIPPPKSVLDAEAEWERENGPLARQGFDIQINPALSQAAVHMSALGPQDLTEAPKPGGYTPGI